MIKWISFIVLTHFFQFNQLKIVSQPGHLLFKVKPTIFFYSVGFSRLWLSYTTSKTVFIVTQWKSIGQGIG